MKEEIPEEGKWTPEKAEQADWERQSAKKHNTYLINLEKKHFFLQRECKTLTCLCSFCFFKELFSILLSFL